MTPEESDLLSHIGTLIYYGIVVLIVDCTFYGRKYVHLAAYIGIYVVDCFFHRLLSSR